LKKNKSNFFLIKIVKNTFELFFPTFCESCGKHLVKGEFMLCTHCRFDIPKTNFHKETENPVEEVFWGRVPVQAATSYSFYSKFGIVKNLLHKLKYKSKPELGILMGNFMGDNLLQDVKFQDVDLIIPLPIHSKRERERGYNQSLMLAYGINEVLGKPIENNNLYRAIETKTQTRKKRDERWQNVQNIFDIKNMERLENKHILLIDDVLTTGATLEAAAETLLKVKGIKISIAVFAFTKG